MRRPRGFEWDPFLPLKERLIHFFLCNNRLLDGCIGHRVDW